MLELICHQSYTWNGLPADKSPYHNDGKALNTSGGPDGQDPGSGYIVFPQDSSRVLIPPGKAWQPLTALKIEALVKVDPALRRTSLLVSGDGSFRFGILEGALEASFTNASGTHNYIRSADAYAPDHGYHPVPVNKWVRVGFEHDGFARMRLFMDGVLVGETLVHDSIPAVQGAGVAIGNDVVADGNQFPGEMDELKIWRLDPKAVKREFLGRPFTHKTATCWTHLAKDVAAWRAKHPAQFRHAGQQFGAERARLMRAALLLPDAAQAKLRMALAKVLELWLAGHLGDPAMATALCDLVALLRSYGIDPWEDPERKRFAAELAGRGISKIDISDCDKDFAAFAALMEKAVATCGRAGGKES